MGSFLSVCAVIIIAVCFVAGVGIVSFLSTYLVPVSIIFWGAILVFVYCMSKNEKNVHEKCIILSAPFCLIPVYYLVTTSLPEILSMKGFFEPFLAVCIELPMCICFTLLVGIGIGWVGTRFDEPVAAVSISAIGNIIFTFWVTNLGV